MSRRLLAAIAILGLVASVASAQEAAKQPETFTGEVVAVLDGDTIEVMHRGKAERVRLNGIDCPEKDQAFGSRAKQFTSDLVTGSRPVPFTSDFRCGKEVTVAVLGTDLNGRTIASVILPDGRILNYEIISAGFAWWYRAHAPGNKVLERLEQAAREEKHGLWRDENPVPPWEYRAGREKKGVSPESDRSQQPDKTTGLALMRKVTLRPPYSPPYKGAPTDKLPVQYAVMDIAKQAGLGYAFEESEANLGSTARDWVRPQIVDEPLYFALSMIVAPKDLMYRIEESEVVLLPAPIDVLVYTRIRSTQPLGVFITETGKKYHRSGCRYLRTGGIPVDLEEARRRGHTPCSLCEPPR